MIAAVLIVTLGGSSGSSGPPAALTPATPPHYFAQVATCTKVLEKLPINLGKLTPRIVHPHPESPAVVAWGDPAVVLSCGVDRPKALHPGSSTQFFDGGQTSGPFYAVKSGSDGTVYTTVDRAVYISISVPSNYQGSDVLPPLSKAIGTALPAVCAGGYAANVPTKDLCAERK